MVTPLFNGRPGDLRTDLRTGAAHQVRYDPDAGVHFEGGGSVAFGTKFVLVAARSAKPRERIILDVEWVPNGQQEAAVAMACFSRLKSLVPGAQGVLYDSALRGVHRQALLREHGLLPINKPRGSAAQPSGRSVPVETHPVRDSDGSVHPLRLVARGGAVGIQEEAGAFTELRRARTMRYQDRSGLYRWYSELKLPPTYGQTTILVRLDASAADVARRFNRTEHVLAIPPSDPDFKRLYGRRSDAESINRGLEDTLYWNHAHSVGHARQLLNLLGYALMVNALALRQHRKRQQSLPLAA